MTTFDDFSALTDDPDGLAGANAAWLADLFDRHYWTLAMDVGYRVPWCYGDDGDGHW